MRIPLLLCVAAWSLLILVAPAEAQRSALDDPLAELARLAERVLEAEEPDPPAAQRAETLLDDLRLVWTGQESRRPELARGIADWLGAAEERRLAGRAGALEKGVADRALDWFGRRIGAELAGELALSLAPVDERPEPRVRAGLCQLLAASDQPAARTALFAATRDASGLVGDTAVRGLAGRDDQAVHTLFVDLLEAAEAGTLDRGTGTLEQHFAAAGLARGDAAFARVLRYVRRRLAAEDWRRASRALVVGRCLEDEVLLGPLIEALPIWIEREKAGKPAKRIQGDLLAELRRRTGRQLGLHPERWRLLLEAFRAGELILAAESEEGGRPYTEASFFGLRPWTDRVVFVIDRSGSMDQAFGPQDARTDGKAGRSRHEEAIARLVAFLEELGPRTRFDVVLFSDDVRRWKKELVSADARNLSAVERWVRANGTGGGTMLRPGVLAAARIEEGGAVALDELEADTVIVLCDGRTSEGPGWVAPFLRRVNHEARLRFHAVRIGGVGDGALRALCEQSGGDLVRVDG